MAKRIITHFKVGAQLFNDITNVLFNLPAITSRDLLNRIESKTGGECEPMFKVELDAKKPATKKTPRKKAKRRVRKPPVTRKKVAKSKRRS